MPLVLNLSQADKERNLSHCMWKHIKALGPKFIFNHYSQAPFREDKGW